MDTTHKPIMDTIRESEAKAIIDLAVANSNVRHVSMGLTDHPFVVVPKDYAVHSLETMLPHPLSIKKMVSFTDVTSFVEYVTRFQASGSSIFITRDGTSAMVFTCVLDYHVGKDAPTWCTHAAILKLTLHPVFARWNAKFGNTFITQEDFATFLELNTIGIIQPSAADLLEIVATLTATQNIVFRSGIRTQNGDVQLVYEQNTDATCKGRDGTMTIPRSFTLSMPIYNGTPNATFEVKLFYRIGDDRKLRFRMAVPDLDYMLETAQTAVKQTIKNEIKDIYIYE